MQLLEVRALRAAVDRLAVGLLLGMLVGISACGGGGGSSNPVLGSLAFTTNENVALTGALTAKDPGGSQVTFSQTSNPASGKVGGFTGDGKFTYTPNPNFTGSDSFGIQATDAGANRTAAARKAARTREAHASS